MYGHLLAGAPWARSQAAETGSQVPPALGNAEDLSRENVQVGADCWKAEPGAGFQAGQVQADSHLTRLPGGPHGLTHFEALEVTLGLSLGPANHCPLRGQFPTARAQVWREMPQDLGQASRRKLEIAQCPPAQGSAGP